MNQLSQKDRARILGALVEGMSIRATSRMFGVSKTTVAKLIRDVGSACEDFQRSWIRDLTCKDIQLDEIWSFVHGKQKNLPEHLKRSKEHGTVWTFVGICRDCKLIPTYYAGQKTLAEVENVLGELHRKIPQRFQLSTDAFETYTSGVVRHFDSDQIDYGRIDKNYTGQGSPKRPDARYSPGTLVTCKG